MVIYESEFETKRLKFKQRIEIGHRMYITEREAEIRFLFLFTNRSGDNFCYAGFHVS